MDEVLYEIRDHVAEITINRPEKMNALNAGVRQGLLEAFLRASADPDCRVLLLTGSGDKAFSAGADLTEMAETAFTVPPKDFIPILRRTVETDKPAIAAVNGVALAGGFLLAQMCDLVVAAEHAIFSISEVRRGRTSPWAVPLARMIPRRAVMELLLTGSDMTAQRAYEVGLINHVVPADRLMTRARELAVSIARNAPLSVAAALRIGALPDDMGVHAALEMAHEICKPVYNSSDAIEGPRAFSEKREPEWTGH